jgi:hypothetical protein
MTKSRKRWNGEPIVENDGDGIEIDDRKEADLKARARDVEITKEADTSPMVDWMASRVLIV